MAVDRQAVADALAWANAKTGLFQATRRPPLTPQQRKARRILECAEVFARGCTNAGPMAKHVTREHDLARCAECAALFVDAVRAALGDAVPVPRLAVRWNVPPGDVGDADTSGVLHGGAGT